MCECFRPRGGEGWASPTGISPRCSSNRRVPPERDDDDIFVTPVSKASSDDGDSIAIQYRRQFGAPAQPAPRPGIELVNGPVINCDVLILIQARRVADPVGPVRVLIERKACSPTGEVRSSPYGIRGYAHHDRVAASKVDELKRRPNNDLDMDIAIEIIGRDQERSRILVLGVADDRLEKRNLEGGTHVIDAEALAGAASRIGEPARRVAEAKRIEVSIEEEMMA